ncbi:hypothetical protein Cgig2_007134 [Carnegiea gigantea]|uniref:Protein kinase domain-containing protein n=1 Tax=Carnegiea gigantea TaxID=171969 RepID=A0A9Q1KLL2_9CARY|nr:hypothetical protein Cgig2_007134 [Carnegiea gigantea]
MAAEQNFFPCIVVADIPMEEKWISVEGEITEPWTARVKVFSYSEIENMISGFQRRLGEGGFGYVYYGCLAEGRRRKDVAVKVLSKDAPKQFSTEVCYFGPTNALLVIAMFGKISHKNLVSLIGYCEEPDNLALAYEYMAGGDLKALLSGSDSLSWKTRLRIAIDSAQRLDYLHDGCRPAIIHRDVKTPNILLNQHLLAKIADFGFSKIFPDEYISVLSTRVIGTPSYVDPQ